MHQVLFLVIINHHNTLDLLNNFMHQLNDESRRYQQAAKRESLDNCQSQSGNVDF